MVATLTVATAASSAETYPNKALRLIVPFPPGGGTDAISRVLGHKLTERWGVPVIVDNRGGANGIIAAQLTAEAASDGYTILLITAGHAINPSLHAKLPYDAIRDFVPVTSVAFGAFALVVHPSVPATSVKELIALAKTYPGKLNFASSGTGSPNHLAGEMFKRRAQVNITHVPYKGAGPALAALLAGDVDLAFGTMVSVPAHLKAGKLRALAVTTAKRSSVAPDIPTMSEAALPGFDVSSWFGVVAPAGTKRDIILKLSQTITDIVNMSDVRQRFAREGLEPLGSTPEQFLKFLNSEIARWRTVVQQSGVRAE